MCYIAIWVCALKQGGTAQLWGPILVLASQSKAAPSVTTRLQTEKSAFWLWGTAMLENVLLRGINNSEECEETTCSEGVGRCACDGGHFERNDENPELY